MHFWACVDSGKVLNCNRDGIKTFRLFLIFFRFLRGVIYIMISAFIMREEMNNVFEQLSEIYDISEYYDNTVTSIDRKHIFFDVLHTFPLDSDSDSVNFLSQVNEKSEWMCGYVKFAIGYSANIVLNSFLSICLCWIHNKTLDVDQFYHPLIAMLVEPPIQNP